MLKNTPMCAIKIRIDCLIDAMGSGFSKKLRHAAMCVVNKYGLMLSKTGTSSVPIMVNKIIIDMVVTIGPIELSEKQESIIDSVATVANAKNAITKPDIKRQIISFAGRITKPSLLSTIKSPLPNTQLPTTTDKKPIQTKIKKV